jgi:hypothetical protein
VAATTNEHIPEDIGMKVHDQLQAFLNTSAELKVWFGLVISSSWTLGLGLLLRSSAPWVELKGCLGKALLYPCVKLKVWFGTDLLNTCAEPLTARLDFVLCVAKAELKV